MTPPDLNPALTHGPIPKVVVSLYGPGHYDPDFYAFFDSISEKKHAANPAIPYKRTRFRDICNQVMSDASTGNIRAIKALKMLPRMVLFPPRRQKKNRKARVTKRVEDWACGRFSKLYGEFSDY